MGEAAAAKAKAVMNDGMKKGAALPSGKVWTAAPQGKGGLSCSRTVLEAAGPGLGFGTGCADLLRVADQAEQPPHGVSELRAGHCLPNLKAVERQGKAVARQQKGKER